jgi:hypothetical protein
LFSLSTFSFFTFHNAFVPEIVNETRDKKEEKQQQNEFAEKNTKKGFLIKKSENRKNNLVVFVLPSVSGHL